MEILKILPKNLLSRAVGELAKIEEPSIVATKARDWFIKRYNINMDEAELPLAEYPSISRLFTRKLKPGIRPIGSGIVHPCDGVLTRGEVISGDSLIQAKGRSYSLQKLLAFDPINHSENEIAPAPKDFVGGSHLVYYLCPTDYHRVHSPISGEIIKVVHVPGHLWPVNDWSVNRINELFAVNERVVFYIRTSLGVVALVMVGATNVGHITVSFDKDIKTNCTGKATLFAKTYSPPVKIEKGEELGIFNMGSTVVMLYGPGLVNVLPATGPTRLGQSL